MSDYVEFTNKEVTCRKAHSCGWCAESIGKGEAARYREYIFEDQWVHDHMHLDCYEAMQSMPNNELCDGWMPGDFMRAAGEG
jgi:hypothetical protein